MGLPSENKNRHSHSRGQRPVRGQPQTHAGREAEGRPARTGQAARRFAPRRTAKQWHHKSGVSMPKPANTVSNLDQSKVGPTTTTTIDLLKKSLELSKKQGKTKSPSIIPDLPEKAKKKQRA